MDSHDKNLDTKSNNQQEEKVVTSNNMKPSIISEPPQQESAMEDTSSNHSPPNGITLPDSPWSLSDLPEIWRSEAQLFTLPDSTQHTEVASASLGPIDPNSAHESTWDSVEIPELLDEHPIPELEGYDFLNSWSERTVLQPIPASFCNMYGELKSDPAGETLDQIAESILGPEKEVYDLLPSTEKRYLSDDDTPEDKQSDAVKRRKQSISETISHAAEKETQPQSHSPQAAIDERTYNISAFATRGNLQVGIDRVKVDDYADYYSVDYLREDVDDREEPGITLEEIDEAGIRAGFPPIDYEWLRK